MLRRCRSSMERSATATTASTAPLGAPPPMPSAPVLGVPLALTDYEGTLDWIDAAVRARARAYVCVAATHTVMACREDTELRAAVRGADFTVPDGQPLVWALNLLGHRHADRVYGPELMDRACERAARDGTRCYLYGGRDAAATTRLAEALCRRHPGLHIAGCHSPPFRPLTAAEEEAVIREIERCAPDVVWVGLGVPKQEKWMARMRPRLTAPVLLGVGAALKKKHHI